MKKVIISGAAGFIGNAVARYMISQGIQVIAIVRPGVKKSGEAFRLINLDADIIECDLKEIGKLPKLINNVGFDAFFQFAWDGVEPEAFMDYERQINNIKWTVESVKAAATLECKKYIGAGSITQMELLCPEGRYYNTDRHKYFRAALFASEAMGRACAVEVGIEFIWPIIINVYGEGETAPRLINNMIRNLLNRKHQAFSSGEQLYDFIHIDDAAYAFYLIGEKGKEEFQYIIGSGSPQKLKEYLLCIRDIVAPDISLGIGELDYNGLEMDIDILGNKVLAKELGFEPKVSFEEGIKRTLAWIKNEG